MDEPVRRPEKRAAPVSGETASRSRRPAYSVDVPLGSDDEEEVLSLRGPSAKPSRTESTPKRTTVRKKTEEKPVPRVETFQIPLDEDPIQREAEDNYPVIAKAAAAPVPRR